MRGKHNKKAQRVLVIRGPQDAWYTGLYMREVNIWEDANYPEFYFSFISNGLLYGIPKIHAVVTKWGK